MSEQPIAVSILDREFLVACTPEERPGLVAAAALVDGRMRELRAAARTASADRIAVMAALNFAHELLQLKQSSNQVDTALGGELDALRVRLDAMLAAYAR
ncbi:MAG TPA: cell division protein ZapA [Candidatus Saccharimonadia bacterium]|nr:cell division protein ZapA [Candidatus Saccharimonadia bacterium]